MTISKKLRGMKLPPGYNACLLLDAANEIDRLTRELAEARAERDALRADAQRWRLFDKHAQDDIGDGTRLAEWLQFDGVMKHGSRAAAIDAAMAQPAKERT